MNHRLRPFVGLLLAACTAHGAQRIGPIEAIALSQKVDSWRFGYIEHRLQLRNLDPGRVHTIDVTIPDPAHGGEGGIERLARTVVLHPGDTAVLSLPQPARPLRGSNMARIAVRGVDSGRVIVPSLQSAYERYLRNRIPVFVSRGVNSDSLGRALSAGLGGPSPTTSGHRHSGHPDARLTRAESEIAAWSPNWLGYTSYAGVILSAAEWRAAAPALRDALLRYAACGGILVCVGGIDPPARWILDRQEGDGLIQWTLGAGHVLSLPAELPESWDATAQRRLAAALHAAAERWSTEADIATSHARFPVIERLTIPVAGIFYLLLGFAILAGPVLLTVLARRQRRIWLLWIAPAVSILAGGIVLVYALLSDGITPTRRADTLTLLDQVRQEGALVGVAGYYAPLTPGGGLRFAADTALAPFEPRHSRLAPGWRLDFTRDQHLVAGWVQARVPLTMQVRKPFTAHERIDIRSTPDGGHEALNGLGADLLSLRVRAADGRWFETGPLAAGRQAVLRPVAAAPSKGTSAAAAVAAVTSATAWADGLASLTTDTLQLEPGTYAAELARNPFLERGLDGRLHNRERSLLIGRFAEHQPGGVEG